MSYNKSGRAAGGENVMRSPAGLVRLEPTSKRRRI
jgi:hypothetical protein